MSNLSHALSQRFTGRIFPKDSIIFTDFTSLPSAPDRTHLEEFEISAIFSIRFTQEKNYFNDANYKAILEAKQKFEDKIKQAKKVIINHVFGEFRDPLFHIQHLLMERQYDKAEEAVTKLREDMFQL